jgi:pimeloyl-ACP methyl ester carboxylesterase
VIEYLPIGGGGQLAYELEGEGRAVAFLNGILMSMASWQPLLDALPAGYRCLRHDFRGQLRSSQDLPIPAMDIHAEDFKALLDHLEIERCHLVGTSYGGEVALLFALAYPERVSSLTVIASVSYSDALLRRQVSLWSELSACSPGLLYEALASTSYSAAFLTENAAYLEQRQKGFLRLPPVFFQAFRQLCAAFLQFELPPARLAAIAAPTLIVAAEKDILKTPAYSAQLAAHIPGARLEIIPGAGHALVIEQPEAVAELVQGMVAKVLAG